MNEGVIDRHCEAALIRFFHQTAGLVGTLGDRFFHKQMLTGLQGGPGNFEMQGDRCRDDDDVGFRIVDGLAVVSGRPNAGVAFRYAR